MPEQRNITANLAERAACDAKGSGKTRESVSMGVPWQIRQGETQTLGETLGDSEAVWCERRERARCSAELQHADILQCGGDGPPLPYEGVQPARGFESERDRRRLLQPGSARHGCSGMASRMVCRGRRGTIEAGEQHRHRALKLQHRRRVENVLARGAPVNIPRGIAIDRLHQLRQMAHERNRRNTIRGGFHADRVEVVSIRAGRLANGYRGLSRNDAELRLHLCERGLHVQHRLQARTIRHLVEHVCVREERRKQIG